MFEILEHTLHDTIKLIPFLFITYLVMELLEHKAGDKTAAVVRKAGRLGPMLGALAGAVPQCGFSAAASSLYAGRVVTMGTLLAIYLSTSDEMLPILISENAAPMFIIKVLGLKIVIGMAAGFAVDLIIRARTGGSQQIQNVCKQEHCRCEHGIVKSALRHTLKITLFILLITLVLNLVLHNGGEEVLEGLIWNRPILGSLAAGVIGLIPNCAASVVITKLYLEGAMGFGAMMSGLLVGAGVGIMVLCRVNRNIRENITVIVTLYLVGAVSGIILELLNIV